MSSSRTPTMTPAEAVQLTLDIYEKQALLQSFAQRLQQATRYDPQIDINDEQAIYESLHGVLTHALDTLKSLAQNSNSDDATQQLIEIKQTLSGSEWRLALRLHEDLDKLVDRLKKDIDPYRNRLSVWEDELVKLEKALNDAVVVRAAILSEKAEQRLLDSLFRQVRLALQDEQYANLLRDKSLHTALEEGLPLVQGEQELQLSKGLRGKVAAKIRDAKKFCRQAGLLFLQSPLVGGRCYHYNVLLRTASEAGAPGINIQSTSTIVKQDRQLMTAIIQDITKAVSEGQVRKFNQQRSRQALIDAQPSQSAQTALPNDAQGSVGESLRFGEAIALPGVVAEDFNSQIREIGELMYRLFMPEQIQAYLTDTPCSVTITTNDMELPWELMSYKNEAGEDTFLCLDRPVARLPMGRAFPRDSHFENDGLIRFLLIYADPTGNLANAGKEVSRIKEALESKWQSELTIQIDELRLDSVTGRELNRRLRDVSYDVIHFAGHAVFESKDADLSGLLLHKREVFYAQKIRRLLRGRPLVFLNACQTGRTANEEQAQEVDYFQRPAEGLASAFIYGGALGCIGSLWPIYDDAAADFAIAFYNRVLEGHPLGEATRLARCEIRNDEKYRNEITWASFVLYGDPTAQLVR